MDKKTKHIAWIVFGAVILFCALNHLGVVFGFFSHIVGIVMPVIAGGILAYFLTVPMNGFQRLLRWFCRKYVPRAVSDRGIQGGAVVLTLLSVLLVLLLVMTILIPELVASVTNLYAVLRERVPEWIRYFTELGYDMTWIQNQLNRLNFENLDVNALMSTVTSSAGNIVSGMIGAATSVVSGIITAVIAIIMGVYFMASKDTLCRQTRLCLYAVMPQKIASGIHRGVCRVNECFSRFLTGQCVEAVIIGTMLFTAFSLLRLPYAPLIAIMAAVFSFIPYIGSTLACLIGVLLILLSDPLKALIALVVFLVIQFVEGQFIYPRVVGGSVGLSPLWTLLAAFLGGNLFGVVGMIFFIPLTAAVYSLVRDLVYARLREKELAEISLDTEKSAGKSPAEADDGDSAE
ncbi:MAG: AI-2E family transporter [Clostridia bacterium]|nr:AI-2E family transporter [Clostridia bacterium]